MKMTAKHNTARYATMTAALALSLWVGGHATAQGAQITGTQGVGSDLQPGEPFLVCVQDDSSGAVSILSSGFVPEAGGQVTILTGSQSVQIAKSGMSAFVQTAAKSIDIGPCIQGEQKQGAETAGGGLQIGTESGNALQNGLERTGRAYSAEGSLGKPAGPVIIICPKAPDRGPKTNGSLERRDASPMGSGGAQPGGAASLSGESYSLG